MFKGPNPALGSKQTTIIGKRYPSLINLICPQIQSSHLTNDDENIDADQRCTVATYKATDREDTIQVINTSTNDARGVFQFAIGTGVQQNANNQLFVSFSEVGQCPSYDQFSNGKIGCFTLPRPPVPAEEQFENYRGTMKHVSGFQAFQFKGPQCG